jgi:DNA-binding PadR family transcriptional regulator
MKAKRELTELEGCVLGEIWDKGPCTPYAIRQEFLRSLNPYWSGSAGAIYPLVRRLEQHGLVRSTDHTAGRKQSKRYVLTAAGKRELRRWLGPPLTEGTVGVPMDPLRNRLLYLQSLPADQQASFLKSAEEGLRLCLEQLKGVGVERAHQESSAHMLVLEGAIAMMQSRIEWLHAVIAGVK